MAVDVEQCVQVECAWARGSFQGETYGKLVSFGDCGSCKYPIYSVSKNGLSCFNNVTEKKYAEVCDISLRF